MHLHPAEAWEISADSISVRLAAGEVRTIERFSIALIGEYTNENGPFADDYFLALVTCDDEAYDVPLDSSSAIYLEDLRNFTGCDMNLALAGDTSFNSSVIWPIELRGAEFIRFERISCFRVRLKLIPLADIRQERDGDTPSK